LTNCISTYHSRVLCLLIIFLIGGQLNALGTGRINKSDWEEVTNGQDYFEKSGEKEAELESSDSKNSRSPKTESDRGYDPEEMQSKNFKLSIRLQFIYVVRLLSEKGLISWKKHKTNSAYGRELKKHEFSNKYNHLNLLFEHVWYGNLEFSDTDLSEINNSFNDSVTHLKNLKR